MIQSLEDDGFRPFLFEYQHEGATWGIKIVARDASDARARARALGAATLKGPVVFSVPAEIGPFARLVCTVRNFVSGLFWYVK